MNLHILHLLTYSEVFEIWAKTGQMSYLALEINTGYWKNKNDLKVKKYFEKRIMGI